MRRPDAGPFWSRSGLLFASTQDVRTTLAQLIKAQPFLGPVAADPSIRGLMGTLTTALQGISSGQASLEDLHTPIRQLADTLEKVSRAGKTPPSSPGVRLITGVAPDPRELRHVILVDPEPRLWPVGGGQKGVS